jgi:hypothetical protein
MIRKVIVTARPVLPLAVGVATRAPRRGESAPVGAPRVRLGGPVSVRATVGYPDANDRLRDRASRWPPRIKRRKPRQPFPAPTVRRFAPPSTAPKAKSEAGPSHARRAGPTTSVPLVDSLAVSGDRFQYPLRGLGPHVGSGVLAPGADVGVERTDGAVRGAPEPLVGQLREPALDHAQPRARGWGEVQIKARVSGQPASDLRGFVGRAVVEHEVYVQVLGWAASQNGYWRVAGSWPLQTALPNAYWHKTMGLKGFTDPTAVSGNAERTARCGPACRVVRSLANPRRDERVTT